MSIHLVRHAFAGERKLWAADDHLRPLSAKGAAQADALVGLLAAVPIEVVLSSPSVRCVQTVEPLARARGLTVTNDDGLAEGKARKAVELIPGLVDVEAVLCTHGDVIPEVLAALEDDGVRIEGPWKWQKGSVWTVHSRDGAFTHATYTPVPKVSP